MKERKGVLIARKRPKAYMATETQRGVREAAEFCGIRKGMSRVELRKAMRECIPEYWKAVKQLREGEGP